MAARSVSIVRGQSSVPRTRNHDVRHRDQRPKAISLRECCDRLGISLRTGERLVADGPVPDPRTAARRTRASLQ
jgi:predicted DNA-binding transcriptional regulator AlpA